MIRFRDIRKDELVKALKPLEGKSLPAIRKFADDTEDRGDVDESAAAQVLRNACDLLEK